MPVMLERWNDERMDGLEGKVDDLGEKVDDLGGKVNVLAVKVDVLSDLMREQRREMKAGFERVDDRFERMQRMMFNGMIGLTSGFLAGFAALVVALH